jgi:hypothetical protein
MVKIMAALDALYAAQEALTGLFEDEEDMGPATEDVQGACFSIEGAIDEMREALAKINESKS